MKALIVTFVRAYNYGAVLQCYALSQKLKQLGVDIEVLDYFPKYFRDTYSLAYLSGMRYFPYRPLCAWAKFVPVLRTINARNKAFEKFILSHIPLSKKQYETFEELDHAVLSYDSYISGSDQVWANGCVPFDPVYFLQFDSAKDALRFSYAASFGCTKIPEELRGEYQNRLVGWNAHSVREASAVDLLEELIGEKAQRCLDPTLLLDCLEWQRFVGKKPKKPYILVYNVNNCKELLEYARQLSQKKGIPAIVITGSMRHDLIVGEDAKAYGLQSDNTKAPDKFVSMLANAKYVLTDSFHGTVFSTIFHKKFMVLIEQSWGYRNHRAEELLLLLNINNHDLAQGLDRIDSEVDWDDVDNRLKVIREESVNYLKKISNRKG